MQEYATKALRKGLIEYDRRHGYKGAIGKIKNIDNYANELKEFSEPVGLGDWQLAVVLKTKSKNAKIQVKNADEGTISIKELKWARKIYE